MNEKLANKRPKRDNSTPNYFEIIMNFVICTVAGDYYNTMKTTAWIHINYRSHEKLSIALLFDYL